MRRVFETTQPFRVPDGTLVAALLNSKDRRCGLPFGLLDDFSIAAGTIGPRSKSKIHLLPFVTQVTFVRRGKLQVCMKAARDAAPYRLRVGPDQAVLTECGTLLQLANDGARPCEVLYIASPAYLFEVANDRVVYDDAVALAEDWPRLAAAGWHPARRLPTIGERRRAARRLAATAAARPRP